MERTRNAYKVLFGKHEGKDHSEEIGVGGRTILEWILGKQDGKV
jgi:hypothetical protein